MDRCYLVVLLIKKGLYYLITKMLFKTDGRRQSKREWVWER